MKCPNGHPVDIDDPGTVGHIDVKDEEGEEERLYWCHRCKVVFVFEPEWDS
jgi:hypothetical protein